MSTHLVIGLGNPGRKYEKTRHNAGFLVVDRLASESSEVLEKKQLGALVASVRLGNSPTILAKPQSFMNLSGQPATSLRGYYKVENDDIVVVHDDVDIPFGEVRVKSGGGHGGHNGLRDINQKLGTNCYARVRVGVGRPPEGHDTANYVLGRFSSEESSSLDDLIGRAADATRAVVDGGVASAMNTFNVR